MRIDLPWADERLYNELAARSGQWLVTGAAGFIGSNLLEALLRAGQRVRGLDNFSTGYRKNLDEVRRLVGEDAWSRCEIVEGDIRNSRTCTDAMVGIDHVLHQAALGSVPRSIADPLTSNDVNVTGFLNVLDAARVAGVQSFVYAASSSTYGDEPALPKIEHRIGEPLSPYAVTKRVNEMYADVYARVYGFRATGLRYFNVFGPRQDPDGAYAAVIPRWSAAMLADSSIAIHGDGETSRDFCYVANAVQANIRAALAQPADQGGVYNVAVGEQTSLNALFGLLRETLATHQIHYHRPPQHGDFRPGDVRHSLADIGKARAALGYHPSYTIASGLKIAMPWYIENARLAA